MGGRVVSNFDGQGITPWITQNFFSKPENPRAIIFLDRDDTLVKDFGSKTHKRLPQLNLHLVKEISIISKKLNHRIIIVVITNQAKIFKKETSVFKLRIFHVILVIYCRAYGVRIQRIVTCPHIASTNCECRKPKPTTILDTINKYDCKLIPRFMIGNSITDIQAGLEADCVTLGINGKVLDPIYKEVNRLFLGYFKLESSFAPAILNKIAHH